MKILTFILLSVLAGLPLFYLLGLNHVAVNSVGLAYDSLDGRTWVQQPGWHLTHPGVFTTSRTTLPQRAVIDSGARATGIVMLRFNPDAALDYLRTQGFEYETEMEFRNELLGYYISGQSYPFLEVIK